MFDSKSCLMKVMKAIVADASEEDFVKDRIALRLRTQQLLDDTDNFIDKTNKLLDEFEKDDNRWRTLERSWASIFNYRINSFVYFCRLNLKQRTDYESRFERVPIVGQD